MLPNSFALSFEFHCIRFLTALATVSTRVQALEMQRGHALPTYVLREVTQGLFPGEDALPPAVHGICALIARDMHVELPIVVAHMVTVAQSLAGPYYVSNSTYDAMVR